MKHLWLVIVLLLVMVAGCGRQDAGSGGSGSVPSTSNELTGTQVIMLTSAPLGPETSIQGTPPPTPNPEPVVNGKVVSIDIDAYLGNLRPTITLHVGQELHVSRPENSAWKYEVSYDTALLTAPRGGDLSLPTDTGWMWVAEKPGGTEIRISELESPCETSPCPGGMPPRIAILKLVIQP